MEGIFEYIDYELVSAVAKRFEETLSSVQLVSCMKNFHEAFGLTHERYDSICEMLAKTSLLTTALLSKPLTPGIGSYFINETTPSKYFISTAIITTFAFLLGGLVGIFGALGAIISGTIIAVIAKRNFVLANGDVLGMSNEVGRLFSLLFMAVALYFL